MDKIEKVTADVMVAEQLKKMIVSQQMEAGDKLPTEGELCDSLGVARHTLREGIKRLSQLGILESKAGSGTYVRDVTYERVEEYLTFLRDWKEISQGEIYDVRMALESKTAEMAARNAQESDIRQLEKVLNHMGKCITEKNYQEFVDYNIKYHDMIANISKNPLLIGLIEAMRNLTRYSMSASFQNFENNALSSQEGHRKILEAIQTHNPVEASARMTAHLLQSAANKKIKY